MLQLHIEQGPVLEWIGFPLGVVKGIAGQTRMKVITFLSKYMHKLLKTYLLHYPFTTVGLPYTRMYEDLYKILAIDVDFLSTYHLTLETLYEH